MKKLLFTFIVALILIPSLFALPLTVLIFQKSAELAKKVAAWNKQCGDKPFYDDACMKKRYQISGELGKFVAMVNDELMLLMIPLKSLTVGVRSWNSRFAMHSILLNA